VIEFVLVAGVLLLLAALFLFFPLMLNHGEAQANRRDINIGLHRDRLAELSAEQDKGLISADEFIRLKTELERRLLDEATAIDRQAVTPLRPKIKPALWQFVVVAVLALLVYQQNGAQPDWQIKQTLQQARQLVEQGQPPATALTKLANQLERRLQQQPDNSEQLMLLASSQMELANYPAATAAFQRLTILFPQDDKLLAQQAQALYLASNRELTAEVRALSDRALFIEPQQPTVLSMLGIASFEIADYASAINYWQQLLVILPSDSSNHRMITAGIAQAQELQQAAGQPVTVLAEKASQFAVAQAQLTVTVSLSSQLEAPEDASVFVYARALTGPKMPLAVARLKVSDLPATVNLDDTMAMMPQLKLSNFEQVQLVARISSRGIANRGAGDLEGQIERVTVADADQSLTISINQQVQ
jgi:cytochrome c-type biogenesis protein CcmH